MTAGARQDGRGSPDAWQRTARAFVAAVESGRLDVPLPGSGATRERWDAFADLAEEDLSLARLGEGHADAIAILAELGGPPPCRGSRRGVWVARTGRALGAGPLSHDEEHSRAVAGLTVCLRQHHAERDLARLGELVASQGANW